MFCLRQQHSEILQRLAQTETGVKNNVSPVSKVNTQVAEQALHPTYSQITTAIKFVLPVGKHPQDTLFTNTLFRTGRNGIFFQSML